MIKSVSVIVLLILVSAVVQAAEPPQLINYQGVLRDNLDRPVADGAYAMVFRFFDDLDSSPPENEIFVDSHGAVTVSNGLFNVALGSGAVSDGSGPGAHGSLAQVFRYIPGVYLQVEVAGETLSPRTMVVSSAYALNSSSVEGHDLVLNGPLDLYVDADSGADTNDCLSPAAACETIQAALDRIPVLLDGEVTVRIGAGTYAGELRLSPKIGLPNQIPWIKLQGDDRSTTIISGSDTQVSGLRVFGAMQVVIENLTFRQFTDTGLAVGSAYVWVNSCNFLDNPGWGIVVSASAELFVRNTTIESNGRSGIECRDAYVVMGKDQTTGERVHISNNGDQGAGVRFGCIFLFEGSATLIGNGYPGIRAVGGNVDLKDLSDVHLSGNAVGGGFGGAQMYSADHGTIKGYQNADIPDSPDCSADAASYGVCSPPRI